MTILFVRFGWFILGAFFGAWIMTDVNRASSVQETLIEVGNLVDNIIFGMGF